MVTEVEGASVANPRIDPMPDLVVEMDSEVPVGSRSMDSDCVLLLLNCLDDRTPTIAFLRLYFIFDQSIFFLFAEVEIFLHQGCHFFHLLAIYERFWITTDQYWLFFLEIDVMFRSVNAEKPMMLQIFFQH